MLAARAALFLIQRQRREWYNQDATFAVEQQPGERTQLGIRLLFPFGARRGGEASPSGTGPTDGLEGAPPPPPPSLPDGTSCVGLSELTRRRQPPPPTPSDAHAAMAAAALLGAEPPTRGSLSAPARGSLKAPSLSPEEMAAALRAEAAKMGGAGVDARSSSSAQGVAGRGSCLSAGVGGVALRADSVAGMGLASPRTPRAEAEVDGATPPPNWKKWLEPKEPKTPKLISAGSKDSRSEGDEGAAPRTPQNGDRTGQAVGRGSIADRSSVSRMGNAVSTPGEPPLNPREAARYAALGAWPKMPDWMRNLPISIALEVDERDDAATARGKAAARAAHDAALAQAQEAQDCD